MCEERGCERVRYSSSAIRNSKLATRNSQHTTRNSQPDTAMSENDSPKINVTRGNRSDRKKRASGTAASGPSVPGPMEVASGLARSVQNLWWAGLGALSVAEEAGTKVFDALVEEGKSWERAQREQTKQTAERVEALADEGAQAVEAVEAQVRDEVNE